MLLKQKHLSRSACSATALVQSPARIEPLEARRLLAAYFVSPAGNDAAPGTQEQPWKTIARVNRQSFRGGDSLFFQGGATFNGTVQFAWDDSGTPAAPILVSSYGAGQARINGGASEPGLFVYDTAGLIIANLNFTGPTSGDRGAKAAMLFINDRPGGVKLPFIRIVHCVASRHDVGIFVIGANGTSGFRDFHVTDSSLHDNTRAGFISHAPERNVHERLYFTRVRAYDNVGVPFEEGTRPATVTGHGILIGQANGVTVERSVAHNNGSIGDGGAGIWAYDSNRVLFQYNEAYANRTRGLRDGDGFDFDQNISNSVMQYNFSHDNDGAGYLMASHENNSLHTNTVARYNISSNDNRKVDYGALHIFGRVTNSQWYNNTVYITPNNIKNPTGIQLRNGGIEDQDVENVFFRNNSIYVTGGLPVVKMSADQLAGAKNVRFEGNNYYSAGSDGVKILWGSKSYSRLSAWRSGSGQERLGGFDVGTMLNPKYVGPGGPLPEASSTLSGLAGLQSYRLREDSPLINAGLDLLDRFGLRSGGRDFWGTLLPHDARFDVGAFEFVS